MLLSRLFKAARERWRGFSRESLICSPEERGACRIPLEAGCLAHEPLRETSQGVSVLHASHRWNRRSPERTRVRAESKETIQSLALVPLHQSSKAIIHLTARKN